jgi:esterase
VKLFSKQYSKEPSKQSSKKAEPLIILHGLFGHQGNWALHAKQLANHYDVYAFDARNHGRSDWCDTMSYGDMAEDVIQTMNALGLDKAHFLAHSMGGKTAMQLAFLEGRRINKLIIVDIAPVDYHAGPYAVLEGLQAVDLDSLGSRAEADEALSQYIEEKVLRDFLLTNLQRKGAEGYAWRFNLEALVQEYAAIKGGLSPQGVYDDEVLFIKGANSDYIQSEHKADIQKLFPSAKIKIIENAGHWVHSEKPEAFIKVVEDYLSY